MKLDGKYINLLIKNYKSPTSLSLYYIQCKINYTQDKNETKGNFSFL